LKAEIDTDLTGSNKTVRSFYLHSNVTIYRWIK
jgi:hypothetical protein